MQRRGFIRGSLAVGVGVAMPISRSFAAVSTALQVWKDPWCGCCTGWARHMTSAGYDVTVEVREDMEALKDRLGVPERLRSCHTGEMAGYVLEGHVPAMAARRLLNLRPTVRGLAVPGMPMGSPGMEGPPDLAPDLFRVMAFGDAGDEVFMRFKGREVM